jgi:hypothetical protein
VTAVKLPEGEMPHNWVNWGTRTIKLHTSKLKSYEACNLDTPAVCKPGFRSVPHEFGHAMGRDDEYVRDSPYLPDADSILNVGRELRRRHFDTLIGEMNKMIPSTTFVVHHID